MKEKEERNKEIFEEKTGEHPKTYRELSEKYHLSVNVIQGIIRREKMRQLKAKLAELGITE